MPSFAQQFSPYSEQVAGLVLEMHIEQAVTSGSGSYSLFEFSSCPTWKISRKRIKSTAIFDLVDSAEANICTRGCSYLIFY
eukprot:gene9669-8493_t